MIVITGDTHGEIDSGKLLFLQYKEYYKDIKYLIICGDFGGVWDKNELKESLKIFTNLPYKVLFVDGNHENFDLLNDYPISLWNGGKVHIINENIIHLMRGQIFNIEGHTFFTFGGGTSIDKAYRREHISWWKEEIPNEEEINEAKENLKKYKNEVDYIITHSIDATTLSTIYVPNSYYEHFVCFKDNIILDWFEKNINYKKWFFGHYHMDEKINDKKQCLYQTFEVIK